MNNNEIDTIARRILSDYDAVTTETIFAEGLRFDLSDAWRVQTAVTRLREDRGEHVIGYKVGAVDPGNQRMLGMPHPAWGRLWDSELHQNGVALKKSGYTNIAIEAEFGVVLSGKLTPEMSLDQMADSVKAIHPVLELHNFVMRSDSPHGHELIANNAINCGVVCSEPVTELSASRTTDLKLIYDKVTVDEWESLRWPDDILAALKWLTTALSEHSITLKSGDLVLTSAWGPPIPVNDNNKVECSSSAFGSVSATFD